MRENKKYGFIFLTACIFVVLLTVGIRTIFFSDRMQGLTEDEKISTEQGIGEAENKENIETLQGASEGEADIMNIDSREKLIELMYAEVLDAEITDVKCKIVSNEIKNRYTMVFAFLKEEGELEYMDYYYDKDLGNEPDPDLTNIPPGYIPKLEEIGISLTQIKKHGTNFGDMQAEIGGVTYYIDWFQIDDTYDGKSNVLLLALVPRIVSVDAEKILNSPDNGKKADTETIDSREELAEVMKMEELDAVNAEITEIRCKETGGNYTVIVAALKEDEALATKLSYYGEDTLCYPVLEDVQPAYISLLEEMGIGVKQIQKNGIEYGEIQAGNRRVNYYIYWFQLDDTYNGEGNVILMAGVPRRISVDADKILAPAQ